MSRRIALTQELRDVLPPSPAWERWLEASGELAPDFDTLPSRPGLWPPHEGLRDRAAWPARREELREKVRTWLTGPCPEGAGLAGPLEVEVADERPGERDLLLHPAAGGTLRATVLLPEGAAPGDKLPSLLMTYTHAEWGTAAVRRGWAAVLVAAGDDLDDSGSVPGPADWSLLGRRAWALSRVLDALDGVPEVDAGRVVVGGHARHGKAAILAAAFDDRFAGVVSSSSGVLGAVPVRLYGDRQFGEGTELLTRHHPSWFHPRLRFFAGREDRLPTDAHEVLALVAPRPVLLGVAVNDQVESVPAAWEVKRVLDDLGRFLAAPGATTLLLRAGGHAAGPDTVERYLDWCQATFEGVDAGGFASPAGEVATRTSVASVAEPPGATVRRAVTRTGLAVDVFAPVGLPHDETPPVVLWCPPPTPATGYVAGYEHATPIHALLARAGCVVVCWDPPGTGSRVHEPLRGPALDEAPAVLDAALEVVDAGPVFTLGYADGARTALEVAARHARVTGAAVVAPDDAGLVPLLRAARGKDVLLVAPRWGAAADAEALRAATATATGPARVEVAEPADFRFGAPARAAVLAWLTRASARRARAGGSAP